jgi:hypothetical protein
MSREAQAGASKTGRYRRNWYLPLSVALLVPCYWQPRIEAGDLSSHIYNAWLAQLIESGRLGGLMLVRQTTNVLFDLILGGLLRWLGAEWAQHMAVSLAVLIFVWGAFAFVSAAAGRNAWNLLPCIAMLAYGWVFHMGFFNFYLAMGLCFWAMALSWNPHPWNLVLAAGLAIPAYTAHALPVLWAAGLMAYVWAARRLSGAARARLLAGSLLLMGVVHAAFTWAPAANWSLNQLAFATGTDQVWVFDDKYYLVQVALLVVWASLFLHLMHGRVAAVVSSIPFQLCVLSAAAVFILPTAVLLPGYHHALAFIAERMSLGVGICVCGSLGMAPARALERYGLMAVAMIFFAFLFHDERALNGFENRMNEVLAQLPAGQRVISPILDPSLRVNALAHVIDRACLGRCYSYANYEPSTAQFRVRAVAANPYVAKKYADSFELQLGRHVVQPQELPMYRVAVNAAGQMRIESLQAGVLCGSTSWEVLWNRAPHS